MGLVLALALVGPAGAGAADWRPEVTGSVGGTLAVLGEPGGGGAAVDAGFLWPVQDGIAFGFGVLADDLGEDMGRLRDPKNGSDLGPVPARHRWAMAVVWRADVRPPERFGLKSRLPLGLGWILHEPFASGTWGYYRIADEARGEKVDDVGSIGFSLAAGLRGRIGRNLAVGPTVRYHRLFNDRAGRYVSAGLDWSWR